MLLQCSEVFAPIAGGAIFNLSDHRLDGVDLESMDCRPALFQGRATTRVVYRPRRVASAEGTRSITSFDFSLDHPEPLLIHEDYGGGSVSQQFLRRVRFAEPAAAEIRAALAALGPVDAAIHLRNTDYKTSLGNFFREVKPRLEGRRVLICCDNPKTIASVRQSLDRSVVVTATDIFDTGGEPLHSPAVYRGDADRRRATVNSLIDLCALATAPELYVVELTKGGYSGFSELAVFLSQNRDVLNTLLAISPAASQPASTVTRVRTPPLSRVLSRILGWEPGFLKRFRRRRRARRRAMKARSDR